MSGRDTSKTRLIRLSDTGECLLQVSHERASVVAAPGVLVKCIAQDVADRLRVDEEPVERVEWPSLVGLLQGGKQIDDDLSDLRHGLRLELRWKVVAELHGQSPRRLNPAFCIFRVNRILSGWSRRLNPLAKLCEALADSSLQVGELLLLGALIKN